MQHRVSVSSVVVPVPKAELNPGQIRGPVLLGNREPVLTQRRNYFVEVILWQTRGKYAADERDRDVRLAVPLPPPITRILCSRSLAKPPLSLFPRNLRAFTLGLDIPMKSQLIIF